MVCPACLTALLLQAAPGAVAVAAGVAAAAKPVFHQQAQRRQSPGSKAPSQKLDKLQLQQRRVVAPLWSQRQQ